MALGGLDLHLSVSLDDPDNGTCFLMEASAAPSVSHGCDSSSDPSSRFLCQGRKIFARAGDPSEEPGIETAVDAGDSDPGDGWLLDMIGAGPVEAGAGIKPVVVVTTGAGPVEAVTGIKPAILVITGAGPVEAGTGIKPAILVVTGAGPMEAGTGINPAILVVTGAGPVEAGTGIKPAILVITGAGPVEAGTGIKPAVLVVTGAGPVEAGTGIKPAVLIITGGLDPNRFAVTVTGRDGFEAPCRLIPGLCIVEIKFENRFHI